MNRILEQNYRKLEKIFGADWSIISHVVLENPPFMNLHFESLGGNHYALSHYFKQNGDLVPDPDMEIRLIPHLKMVEALSYQDSFGYRRVYPIPGNYNQFYLNTRRDLNVFLSSWLRNLVRQGFCLKAACV